MEQTKRRIAALTGFDFLLSAVWIYARIQSPFLIACSYGLIKRFDKIASPYLVAPGIIGICGLFYFKSFEGADFPPFYSHLILAAFFLLTAYFLLWLRFGYSKPDALVLSILTFMAIDELWQTPFNYAVWTHSLRYFEIGMATAGWNLMSIPLIGVFLLKMKGRIKCDTITAMTFGIAIGATTLSLIFPPRFDSYILPDTPYYLLIFPWFLFFIALFRSSSVLLNPFR